MLNAIIRFSVRFRGVVLVLAAMLTLYGTYTLTQIKLDVFPEFAPPMAVVHTDAPGLSSEQVELLVTQPIEQALAGTTHLQSLRSRSLQGLSIVTLVFDDRVPALQARQLVAERLTDVTNSLPAASHVPQLLPLTSATGTVLMLGLTSATRSLMTLNDTAQWLVKPQLLSVPGVSDVVVFGGDIRQLQIQLDPAKLLRYNLSMQDVIAAARAVSDVRGAGFIETTNQRITVHPEAQTDTPTAWAHTVVRWQHHAGITFGDIATVTYAPAPAVGAASVMGAPGVVMEVETQPGADTLAVTLALQQRLYALRPVLQQQGIAMNTNLFRPDHYIRLSTQHLRNALLTGAALVMVILWLFLQHGSTALISATAIPLSLLTALIVLHAMGVTLNTMSLGGLAIALGEVVDDAIIDVENIHRRLRQNAQLASPLSRLRVVIRASLEVRSAVVYATFVVVLVFLPVLAMSGVAGRLFAPLGLAYVLAVLASLAVALTVTPAMSMVLLTRNALRNTEPAWIRRIKQSYLTLLMHVQLRTRAVIIGVGLTSVLAMSTLPWLPGNFIPELREGHYIAHVGLTSGSSLAETMRVGARISRALLNVPGVKSVAQTAGRANEVIDPAGVQLSEFDIDLQPMNARGQADTLLRIQRALNDFPGILSSVNTFLTERIDETMSGATAPVSIQVFGNNLEVIQHSAQRIAQLIGSMHGVASVNVDAPQTSPELSIRLKPDVLAQWGLRPLDVLDTLQQGYAGSTVAQSFDGNRVYNVTVVLAPPVRAKVERLGDLMIATPRGQLVPLRSLADIQQVNGAYQIEHQEGQRLQTVSVTLGALSQSNFVREAQTYIRHSINLPTGVYLLFTGADAARNQALHELLVHSALTLLGILLLLWLAFQSTRLILLVMLNLPFALVGGVVSVLATGADLSLGAIVGFVTLFGISLRNSIMLISHYQHLVLVDGNAWNLATVLRGANERLMPILMTALATGLALLPLALTSGAPGNEIEGPMATVILGGLITSTLLNLLVLPILALRFDGFNLERR